MSFICRYLASNSLSSALIRDVGSGLIDTSWSPSMTSSNESNDIFIAEAIHFIFSIDGTIGFFVLGCSFFSNIEIYPLLIPDNREKSRRESSCSVRYFFTSSPRVIFNHSFIAYHFVDVNKMVKILRRRNL